MKMTSQYFSMPIVFQDYWRRGWLTLSRQHSRDFLRSDKGIWLNDMEWDLSRVESNVARYKKGKQVIIPFAHTGEGDMFGYYITSSSVDCPPVVYCYHDEYRIDFYSPSIESAVFRQVLNFCSSPFFASGNESDVQFKMPIEVARNWLDLWNSTFGIYFDDSWRELIANLIKRPFELECVGSQSFPVLLKIKEVAKYEQIVNSHMQFDEQMAVPAGLYS